LKLISEKIEKKKEERVIETYAFPVTADEEFSAHVFCWCFRFQREIVLVVVFLDTTVE
jgi:hypothetical protein